MRHHRLLRFESIESRRMLAAVAWVDHALSPNGLSNPGRPVAADMDADGDLDVVVSAEDPGTGTSTFQWFENSGTGVFERAHKIGEIRLTRSRHPDIVSTLDIDGDGDLDVVATHTSKTVLFVNPGDSAPNWSSAQVLVGLASTQQERFVTTDLNSDGRQDIVTVVSSNDADTLVWLPGGKDTELSSAIAIDHSFESIQQLKLADLNGDGQQDIVVLTSQRIYVHYVRLGSHSTTDRQLILSSSSRSHGIDTDDVNRDGRVDLITSTDSGILFANQLDDGTFELQLARHPPNPFGDDRAFLETLHWVDRDQNTESNLLGVVRLNEAIGLTWIEELGNTYRPGNVTWLGDEVLLSTHMLIDANTRFDFLINDDNSALGWVEFVDSPSTEDTDRRIPVTTIPADANYGIQSIANADFDGDGREDLLVAVEWTRELVLFRGDLNGFDRHETIAVNSRPSTLVTMDIDADGDTDVLVRTRLSEIFWLENLGDGRFGPLRPTSMTDVISPNIYFTDLNGDGRPEILHMMEDTIRVVTFMDGHFKTYQEIEAPWNSSLSTATFYDVDGDGDLDFVSHYRESASHIESPQGIVVLENRLGKLATQYRPLFQDAYSQSLTGLITGDLDGDGRRDLIGGVASELIWWRNKFDGFAAPLAIASEGTRLTESTRAVDLYGDGDADIIGRNAWFENLGRGQEFLPHEVDWNSRHLILFDLDGDADLDIVSGYHIKSLIWFEQRLIGDVDNDGRFDSRDLVAVFQAGKFEDEVEANSTFDEGDWNDDGDFNTSDIVFAFQSGNFGI